MEVRVMAGAPERRTDADGVVRVAPPRGIARFYLVGAALAFAALAVWFVWLGDVEPKLDEPPAPASDPSSPAPPTSANAPAPARVVGPPRLATSGTEPAEGSEAGGFGMDEDEPQEPEVPSNSPPGVPTGLSLFPPPGTKPLKRGLIVPEDFELPPGYVRHYQTTDDGKRLPAILMFHPDQPPLDANGQPVPVPPDRIVPPELAPAGMPIETLDPPPVSEPQE